MKLTRVLLLNLAVGGFLCAPAFSAYRPAPQEHQDQNSTNHREGENHGNTNHEHGNKTTNHEHGRETQEHRGAPVEHNSNRAHAEHNGNYAQQEHGNRNHPQSARDRGHQRTPSYNFRPQDQQRLRQDYSHSNYRHEVNSRHRARLYRGGYLPNGWRGRMHRLPPQYLREFPAPPRGYLIGYYDGYAVVYSPATGLILQFLNVY
ncbi:MAG TPA: hypothetical protein VF283_08585 [Bryobacteraceae bacterium]